MLRLRLVTIGLVLASTACDPVDPISGECVKGVSIACACTSGRSGAQVCLADHTFGPCDCSVCGNGVVEGSEQCDEGHVNGLAGHCTLTCRNPGTCTGAGCGGVGPGCGDGVVQTGEVCDDGADNSDTAPDACRANCTPATCGDGVVDSGEECDDGNELAETCSVGASSCTVCGASCRFVPGLAFFALTFNVIDAEYNRPKDRLVAVGTTPNALYVIDTRAGTSQSVALTRVPTAVSVGPDGTHAVVGHDAWLSYVDLDALTVVDDYPVTCDVLDVVLAGNGYAHAFPRTDQWVGIHSVALDTKVETQSGGWSIYAGTVAKLHPSGTKMYGADNHLSPSDIERYDIGSGPAVYGYDSPYHGDYPMCGDLWISDDGLRIFTACGRIFRASDVKTDDMTYNGALVLTSVKHLDAHTTADRIAAIPEPPWYGTGPGDSEIRVYDYQYLGSLDVIQLPGYASGAKSFASHGRFVFFDSAGTWMNVLVQADSSSGLIRDWGVVGVPVP